MPRTQPYIYIYISLSLSLSLSLFICCFACEQSSWWTNCRGEHRVGEGREEFFQFFLVSLSYLYFLSKSFFVSLLSNIPFQKPQLAFVFFQYVCLVLVCSFVFLYSNAPFLGIPLFCNPSCFHFSLFMLLCFACFSCYFWSNETFLLFFFQNTIGAENVTYIKTIGVNLFDVARCNALHHLNCQELIWCNVSGLAASEL